MLFIDRMLYVFGIPYIYKSYIIKLHHCVCVVLTCRFVHILHYLTQSFMHSFFHYCICSLIHSSFHLMRLFVHSFRRSVIHLFICCDAFLSYPSPFQLIFIYLHIYSIYAYCISSSCIQYVCCITYVQNTYRYTHLYIYIFIHLFENEDDLCPVV